MSEQRTPEWFAERLGKVTASCIYKVMVKLRDGKAGAERANYAAQLITERLTGNHAESFSNASMQWGTETEPRARAMYSLDTNEAVEEAGFVPHPVIAMAGASPDGLVGEAGLVEIKCPNSATHIATLTGAPIDRKYVYQMQWQMACTGRDWCDFASFDPRLPPAMQLHVTRVHRDEEQLILIEKEVTAFLSEVADTVSDLQARFNLESIT